MAVRLPRVAQVSPAYHAFSIVTRHTRKMAMASSAGPRPALLGPIVSKTNPDVKIPRIIYGTAWKKERTSSLVNQALKAGFRAVDTAAQPRHYNEALVGDGISRAISKEGLKREELYVSSSSPNHSLIQVPRMVVATMYHQCFVGTWYNYLSLRQSSIPSEPNSPVPSFSFRSRSAAAASPFERLRLSREAGTRGKYRLSMSCRT